MQPVRGADNLTTFMCRLAWNLGASASWNPQGLSRPVMGLLYLYLYPAMKGTRQRSWLRHCATSQKVAGSIDSASNRNEYQEYFLGAKAAGAWGWQPYHLHVLIVLKSGSLNLLEPSGPVQACNGIALPLPLPPRSTRDSSRSQNSAVKNCSSCCALTLKSISYSLSYKTWW